MLRNQFELEARALINRHPHGYDDANWRIKYDLIDGEYFIRWSNGIMDRGHREHKCHFKNGKFIYYWFFFLFLYKMGEVNTDEVITLEMIKERENAIRKDLDTMLETLEEKLRVNIMAHVTALLILGILEGRKTADL